MIFVPGSALRRERILLEREECESDLRKFLETGWKYIDPAPFVGGWHLDAIAEHLMAVTDGHIKRLCINVPPRSSKSSLCSVAWPAWTWAQAEFGPLRGPHVQFLSSSYAQTLSLRDSVKTRRLIESPWYQGYWGKRYTMTGDVNTKVRFENDKGGYRLATSVSGTLTGEGGAVILVDDPHNVTEVESELVRVSTLQWWDESLSTRLNDPAVGAFVVIMQRLHQEDLTGHIMSRESENWTWLMLPMHYDSERHCSVYIDGEKFWEDPRTEDGELLCPQRFPEKEVIDLERRLGPFGAAGQLEQSPVPRGGGIIKEEWWQIWKEERYPQCEYVVASLDTAYTEKSENDASALTVWGYFKHDPTVLVPDHIERLSPLAKKEALIGFYAQVPAKIILLYGWQDRLPIHELVQRVIDTCSVDKRQTKQKHRFPVDNLIIESKASGISVAQEIYRLATFDTKFTVQLFDPRKYGDKVARMYAVQHLFANKLIYTPPWQSGVGYAWANEIIEQVSAFPRAAHDDFADSLSMALIHLRDGGWAVRREEHEVDVSREREYHSRPTALYPA